MGGACPVPDATGADPRAAPAGLRRGSRPSGSATMP